MYIHVIGMENLLVSHVFEKIHFCFRVGHAECLVYFLETSLGTR